MRWLIIAAVTMACGSSDVDSTAATSGDAGRGGAGGAGAAGPTQVSSDEANSAEECVFHGGGGDDTVPCDVLAVDFSEPLAMPGVDVVVIPQGGEALTVSEPVDNFVLTLRLSLDDDESHATGFVVSRWFASGRSPAFEPASVTAEVTMGGAAVADETLPLAYRCVEITVDDWCWQASPVTLPVDPP